MPKYPNAPTCKQCGKEGDMLMALFPDRRLTCKKCTDKNSGVAKKFNQRKF